MRIFTLIAALFVIFLAQGQKTIDKRIDAKGISSIRINSDMIFRINVTTTETDQIHIKSGIAGETFETMLLNTEVKNGMLYITTGRSAYYHNIDDKLAAHKVMSVELAIEMPKTEELWIDSALASVVVNGPCTFVNFNLGSGFCRLNRFRGSGVINTKKGNILIENPTCAIDAESRNGAVRLPKNATLDCNLTLRSIDGDITAAGSK